MYRIFAVASDIPRLGAGPLDTLRSQLAYVRDLGVSAELLLDPDPAELEQRLRTERPDCTYMLPLRRPGDATEDDRVFAQHTRLTRLLQHLELAFVGQDYQSQLTLDDKMLAAHISGMHPPGWLLTRAAFDRDVGRESIRFVPPEAYPVIVKPNTLWASQGVGSESVCKTPSEIEVRAAALFRRFGGLEEIRIEKFLATAREFTVTVVGNAGAFATATTAFRYKSPAHVIFSEQEKTAPPGVRSVSYDAVLPEAPEYQRLTATAMALFERFAFRDIARFDMLWADELFVIDVNHMPGLGRAMCCGWTAEHGLEVQQLLALLLVAFDRRQAKRGSPSLPHAIAASLPAKLIEALAGS